MVLAKGAGNMGKADWIRGMLILGCLAQAIVEIDRAAAYEEVAVTDGGALTGIVTLNGNAPAPKGYNLTTLPDQVYCGRISDGRGWRLFQPFGVGEGGVFRQVVVYIESISRGKPFVEARPPRIEAIDCRFLPMVNLVRDDHDVTVVNMDPVMHDIQAYETSHLGPRVLFNVPLPISQRYPHEAGLSAHFSKHYEGQPVTQRVHMTKGRVCSSCSAGSMPAGKVGRWWRTIPTMPSPTGRAGSV